MTDLNLLAFVPILNRLIQNIITSNLKDFVDFGPHSLRKSERVFLVKKWANPGPFSFIFGVFKQTIQFCQQFNVKKCHAHPVYGARIRTHEIQNMSLFPLPLDQGSRPLNSSLHLN